MDYFKQRRAYRDYKMYEKKISQAQNDLYRELLDYANDKRKLDTSFRLMNDSVLKLTGLSETTMSDARNRLAQFGLIKYDKGKRNTDTPIYQIIQLYEDNDRGNLRGNSVDDTVVSSVATSVVGSVDDTGTVLSTSTQPNLTINKTSPRRKKRVYGPDDQNYQLADYLYQKIKANNPDTKKPNLQKWADDVRLMHERDKRDYDKIKRLIDWSQANDFWYANILSAGKLREKYDQLAAQANREYKQVEVPQSGYQSKQRASSEPIPSWFKNYHR